MENNSDYNYKKEIEKLVKRDKKLKKRVKDLEDAMHGLVRMLDNTHPFDPSKLRKILYKITKHRKV